MEATRQSWPKLQPLPQKRSHFWLERSFTEQDFDQLRRGFIPERMEEKWFIYYEGGILFFHRSWTGFCIFELHLVQDGAVYTVSKIFANRDEHQYTGKDNVYDGNLIMFLVDTLLLNRPSSLPVSKDGPADIAQDLHFQHVIGTGPRRTEKGLIVVTLTGIARWLLRWLWWVIRR